MRAEGKEGRKAATITELDHDKERKLRRQCFLACHSIWLALLLYSAAVKQARMNTRTVM